MQSFHKAKLAGGFFFPTIKEECAEGCSYEELREHVGLVAPTTPPIDVGVEGKSAESKSVLGQ